MAQSNVGRQRVVCRLLVQQQRTRGFFVTFCEHRKKSAKIRYTVAKGRKEHGGGKPAEKLRKSAKMLPTVIVGNYAAG